MPFPPGNRPPSYGHVGSGVPSQYTWTVHPYPSRYHGGIWKRPVFGFPYVQSPQAVFRRANFYDPPAGLAGLVPTTPAGWIVLGVLAGGAYYVLRKKGRTRAT